MYICLLNYNISELVTPATIKFRFFLKEDFKNQCWIINLNIMNFACSKYRGRNAELIRLINLVDYSIFIRGELVKQTQKFQHSSVKL